MNRPRDIDRILDAWLGDGPTRAPDRVMDAVVGGIERQRQRPTWRVSWRDSHVHSFLKPLLAVAAVVVIAVAGFALLARPSGSTVGGPTVVPSSAPSVAPSAAATSPWDNQRDCGDNGCGGPLPAGTYTSKGLQPPVTYTLTTPWVNVRDWAEFFMLYPDTPANRALAAAGNYAPYILVLPGPTRVSPSAACPDETAPDAVEVDAAGFVEFLASREHLTTTEPVPVMISGLSGHEVDVGVQPGWAGCLPQTPSDSPPAQTDAFRFIVLDRPDGKTATILLWAPANRDAFLSEAMPIVESFEFDLGAQASPSSS